MSELTVLVPLGGRDVEMRKPTDGSLVVLARTFRGISKIENVDELTDEQRDKAIRNLGTVGKVVEGMIVKDADKDWLDDAMIDGDVSAEEVYEAVALAVRKLNGSADAGPAKKAAAVRRRR